MQTEGGGANCLWKLTVKEIDFIRRDNKGLSTDS